MARINNNIPPFAEEIIINQETNQVQEILNKFKQPIPSNFVELENLKYMCSTQGWKEPTCERYNCLINDKWGQIDIRHTLLEKLELTKVKNIPCPVYISPAVIDKGLDNYFAYNIEDEAEIFLEKTFAVENLEEDINKLFEKIEELENELKENKEETNGLEKLYWQGISTKEKLEKEKKILEKELSNSKKQRKEIEDELTDLKTENNKLTDNYNKLRTDTSAILAPGAANTSPAVNDIELIAQANEVIAKIVSLRTERDNRPNITLSQWNDDYSENLLN